MEKLKQFFANTHVITTIGVLIVLAVIWLVLYLLISNPAEFVAVCVALCLLGVLGYFIFQMYKGILCFVEDYKESRR